MKEIIIEQLESNKIYLHQIQKNDIIIARLQGKAIGLIFYDGLHWNSVLLPNKPRLLNSLFGAIGLFSDSCKFYVLE